MSDRVGAMREGRFEQQKAGDERQGRVTSGAQSGMSGDLFRAYCIILPLVLLAMVVNSLSTIYDIHRGGHEIPLWEPWLWEASSAVSVSVAALVVYGVSRFAPFGKTGWPRL